MNSKINKIEASWFRGFSNSESLILGEKSIVVYGENGSGKSSFVDVLEYVIRGGKIKHLSHEYSGRRQEKGIINTHISPDNKSELLISFQNGDKISVQIQPNGNSSINPNDNALSALESPKVILRQDEVADFIKEQKGEKYSSLLPLLGLGDLDIAIENLKKIEKEIKKQTNLEFIRGEIANAKKEAIEKFGTGEQGKAILFKKFKELFEKYCPDSILVFEDVPDKCLRDLDLALSSTIKNLSAEQLKYNSILGIAQVPITKSISDVRISVSKLGQSVEPLVAEKIEVLNKADIYVNNLDEQDRVDCPSCGTNVIVSEFSEHVEKEKDRLKDVLIDFNNYKNSLKSISNNAQSIRDLLNKKELEEWSLTLNQEDVTFLKKDLNIDLLRTSCSEESLLEIEEKIGRIHSEADNMTSGTPVEAQDVFTDRDDLNIIKAYLDAKEKNSLVTEADILIKFLIDLQTDLREKIKVQSSTAISLISDDIAGMWEILHPDESIEDVNLSFPTDHDKAIEINLKFYGIDQVSPRLTLSEGHRNSLGLCIFLAMAKNIGNENIPIVLDDVIVSFDRNHRGRVGELLLRELSDRQIIIFTHDREWYIELTQLMNRGAWEFKALLPWENPNTGIRWSEKSSTFGDAISLLATDPVKAAAEARKIMDTHLPPLCEELKLKMPFKFREKNDHRQSHEFLKCLVSDGKKSFKIKDDTGQYIKNQEALDTMNEAMRHLVARGNRASHTYSITQTEASDLITVCSLTVDKFSCVDCSEILTTLQDSSGKYSQCKCGNLRWDF